MYFFADCIFPVFCWVKAAWRQDQICIQLTSNICRQFLSANLVPPFPCAVGGGPWLGGAAGSHSGEGRGEEEEEVGGWGGAFSKHRPSGPMLSISWFVCMCVCLSVCLCVCLCVCSLLRYRLNVFLPPLPEIRCPNLLDIRNPWGKVLETSRLRFENFYS